MTRVALREVVKVRGGGTPRRSVAAYYDGDIPWVTPKDMKKAVIGDSLVRITPAGVQNSPAKMIEANSVLVVVRSGVLKHTLPVALTSAPVTLNQDMKALTPMNALCAPYLARLLKHLEPTILSWVRATTADNFPIDKLLDLEVELPPLAEQQRIATIFDEADALRFRRQESLALLDVLPEQIYEFEVAVNGPGYEKRRISDLIQSAQIGLVRAASAQSADRQFAYIKMDAITRSGRLDLSSITNVDASPAEARKYALMDGDLIFNTRNTRELVGKSAVYRGDPCLYNNNLMRLRFGPDVVPEYVHRYLWSREGREQLERRKSGTTSVFAIYDKSLASIAIPVPPIAVQQRLASQIAAVEAQRAMVVAAQASEHGLFRAMQASVFANAT